MNRRVKYYPEILYVIYGSDFPLETYHDFDASHDNCFFHPVKRDFLIASPMIIVPNALICLYMV